MKINNKPTVSIIILITLLSAINGAAGARVILALVKNYLKEQKNKALIKNLKQQSFRNSLHRLYNAGLIERKGLGFWKITQKGRGVINKFLRRDGFINKLSNRNLKEESDTIFIFDIPEKEKLKRNNLRIELICLGFKLLQKSVWLGKGPLPLEFIEYLNKYDLINYIHIFTIKQKGTVS